MLSNLIDRIKLRFRKDRELYASLYDIIGFYPHHIDYYKTALLHKSVYHRNAKGKPVNNERLEFLGDAILDAVVGHIVFSHFPGKREGFLTNTRSKLVQRETLGRLAQEMGVCQLIQSNGRNSSHNSYMGGNAFEALVGAIYLDRGYDACMQFMQGRILAKMINIDKVAYKEVNFKSKLIEWTQKNRVKMEFKLTRQEKDKGGSPIFSYTVMLEGVEGSSGTGFSKKESQQQASKLTLERLRKKPQFIDQVFASKTQRTRMEEEPVQAVPDTEVKDDFIIASEPGEQPKSNSSARKGSGKGGRKPAANPSKKGDNAPKKAKPEVEEADNEEFDLSDITARPQSREEIIAAAEAAAWNE